MAHTDSPMLEQKDHTEPGTPATAETAVAASEQMELKGIAAAPGIAIGPVYLYARDALFVEHRPLEEHEVAEEVERFEEAVRKAEKQLG